jgi:predicted thioredoxin/glutaredoxin
METYKWTKREIENKWGKGAEKGFFKRDIERKGKTTNKKEKRERNIDRSLKSVVKTMATIFISLLNRSQRPFQVPNVFASHICCQSIDSKQSEHLSDGKHQLRSRTSCSMWLAHSQMHAEHVICYFGHNSVTFRYLIECWRSLKESLTNSFIKFVWWVWSHNTKKIKFVNIVNSINLGGNLLFV